MSAMPGGVERGADARRPGRPSSRSGRRRGRRRRPGRPPPWRRSRAWRRCRRRRASSSDAAVAVVGVLVDAQVGHQHDVVAEVAAQVARAPAARCRRGRRPGCRRRPCVAGTPNRITARTPRSASSATSLRRLSRVCCTTPGSDAIGCGSSMPSRTNSGAIRSLGAHDGLGDEVAERRGAPQPARPVEVGNEAPAIAVIVR